MRSSEDSEFPSVCFLLPKRLLRAGCWDVGVCRGARDPTRPLFHLPPEYLFGSCMLPLGLEEPGRESCLLASLARLWEVRKSK